MSVTVLLAMLTLADSSLEERVLASPRADGMGVQLAGGRRRTDVGGAIPAWQYDFGASYARLWRVGSASPHLLGVRAALSFPAFEGVEVSPLLEYRFGDLTTVNLAWGPMWQIDSQRKGAGGYRTDVSVTAGGYPWAFYFGVSQALFGRPDLAITFGVRVDILVYQPKSM
jgi:hypothetical protein